MAAVDHITPIFESRGYAVPQVKVSVGFPSTGGKGRHLGQCWSSKAAEDNINQIFTIGASYFYVAGGATAINNVYQNNVVNTYKNEFQISYNGCHFFFS